MGHLINPISLRLSINSFWNSSWILINTFNYINVFKKDFTLFHFLDWFVKKPGLTKFNLLVSHYKVYRVNNYIYISFFYYNANIEGATYQYLIWETRRILLEKNLYKKRRTYKLTFNHIFEFIFRSILFAMHWILLNSATNVYFQKLNNNIDKYIFTVYNLNYSDITINSITRYISLKLAEKFSIDWILKPILKDLNMRIKNKIFLGFKLTCSGRFTRKQIAHHEWFKKGALHFNTLSSLVKYSETRVRLKYGLCGIKLWINYGNNTLLSTRNLFLIYPIYLPFKYKINKSIFSNNITLFLNYWFFLFLRIFFFKSRTFDDYKMFIKVKLQSLLKNLVYKLRERKKHSIYTYNYNISLLKNNKIIVSMIKLSPLIVLLKRKRILNKQKIKDKNYIKI